MKLTCSFHNKNSGHSLYIQIWKYQSQQTWRVWNSRQRAHLSGRALGGWFSPGGIYPTNFFSPTDNKILIQCALGWIKVTVGDCSVGKHPPSQTGKTVHSHAKTQLALVSCTGKGFVLWEKAINTSPVSCFLLKNWADNPLGTVVSEWVC